MKLRLVVVLAGIVFAGGMGIAAAHGSVSVGFGSDTVTIESGTQSQIDVIVEQADDGVDSYDLSISTDSEGVVAVTDASVIGESAATNVTVGSNGSRLDVSGTGIDRDGPTVDVVTLTLAGRSNGTGTLSIDAATVVPSQGAPYLTSERGTVEVVVGADQTGQNEPPLIGIGAVGGVMAVVVYGVVRRRSSSE